MQCLKPGLQPQSQTGPAMVPVRGSWGGWGLEKGQVSEFGIGTAEEASVHQAGFEEGILPS